MYAELYSMGESRADGSKEGMRNLPYMGSVTSSVVHLRDKKKAVPLGGTASMPFFQ